MALSYDTTYLISSYMTFDDIHTLKGLNKQFDTWMKDDRFQQLMDKKYQIKQLIGQALITISSYGYITLNYENNNLILHFNQSFESCEVTDTFSFENAISSVLLRSIPFDKLTVKKAGNKTTLTISLFIDELRPIIEKIYYGHSNVIIAGTWDITTESSKQTYRELIM